MKTLLFPTALVIAAAGFTMFARQTSTSPAFEVASIKLFKPGTPAPGLQGCHGTDSKYPPGLRLAPPPLGRCVVHGTTLRGAILMAYQNVIPIDQLITEGPNWAGSDRFDIEAKAPDGTAPTEDQLRVMLQNLLADRFELKFHRDSREVSGYALLVAKGGPKFKEATGNETITGLLRMGGKMVGQNVTMSAWCNQLWSRVGSPVVDKTGLPGTYNFTLLLISGESELRMPETADASAGVSIFTALQDQLGLKLEAQKVRVEFFVIDSAERPAEN